MVKKKDEDSMSKPIFRICAKCYLPKSIAHFSAAMKNPTRHVVSLLFLILVAATVGFRFAIRSGFGSIYRYGDVRVRVLGLGSDGYSEPDLPLDFPLFNSTLLKLAEIEEGEVKFRQEIDLLLEGNFRSLPKLRTSMTWRRFVYGHDSRARMTRVAPLSVSSPERSRVWSDFKRALSDWSRKKSFQPDVMDELVNLIRFPIDKQKRKYSSCAVVGNSGILLNKEFGDLIDTHEAVIRLNNARVLAYQKNVGSKTSISFINSNILQLCARSENCHCHPYGSDIPIVMYICQPSQFLDYIVCSTSHKAPLIVTDPSFDVTCARIVKYYSLKRYVDSDNLPNKTFEQWNSIHDGSAFHYSSGMQAVTMALGICDRVSLFGFGKSSLAKHHYHSNQESELGLHDYEAEYKFYQDLVERPQAIPFFNKEFKFPPVVIHR